MACQQKQYQGCDYNRCSCWGLSLDNCQNTGWDICHCCHIFVDNCLFCHSTPSCRLCLSTVCTRLQCSLYTHCALHRSNKRQTLLFLQCAHHRSSTTAVCLNSFLFHFIRKTNKQRYEAFCYIWILFYESSTEWCTFLLYLNSWQFIIQRYQLKKVSWKPCNRLTNSTVTDRHQSTWMCTVITKILTDVLNQTLQPTLDGYRNKCEFTIAEGPDGGEILHNITSGLSSGASTTPQTARIYSPWSSTMNHVDGFWEPAGTTWGTNIRTMKMAACNQFC